MGTIAESSRSKDAPDRSGGAEASNVGDLRGAAAESALARADMYCFFAAVYLSPPNRAFLQQLVDPAFLEDLSVLFGDKAVTELRSFANTTDVDGALDTLKQEFMDLFAVPTGRYVTPFEDVYRGKDSDGNQLRGPLLGERAIDVTRLYREAGAEMDREIKELPTHVGVELAFMSFLCEREAKAVDTDAHTPSGHDEATGAERYRQLQKRFLRQHLNSWFPQLRLEIQAKAASSLYRGLALTTEEFLSRDAASLA